MHKANLQRMRQVKNASHLPNTLNNQSHIGPGSVRGPKLWCSQTFPAFYVPARHWQAQSHTGKLCAASDSSLVSLMLIFVASQVQVGDWQLEIPASVTHRGKHRHQAGVSNLLTFCSALRSIECTISLTICMCLPKGVRLLGSGTMGKPGSQEARKPGSQESGNPGPMQLAGFQQL